MGMPTQGKLWCSNKRVSETGLVGRQGGGGELLKAPKRTQRLKENQERRCQWIKQDKASTSEQWAMVTNPRDTARRMRAEGFLMQSSH